MVVYLTTNSQAHILIIAVHSNVKTISCVQKLVIRILCASLAYKERVIRIHSNVFKLIVKVPVVGNTADTPNPPGLLPF